MAKIGTAHIELKPVINDELLEQLTERIAAAVAEGVQRGMGSTKANVVVNVQEPKAAEASVRREIRRLGRQ